MEEIDQLKQDLADMRQQMADLHSELEAVKTAQRADELDASLVAKGIDSTTVGWQGGYLVVSGLGIQAPNAQNAALLSADNNGNLSVAPGIFVSPIIVDIGGITVNIDGVTVGGVLCGIEVKLDSTGQDLKMFPQGWRVDNNGDTTKLQIGAGLNGTGGILKVSDGSGAGGIDTHGLQCVIDGANQGNISTMGVLTFKGFNVTAAARTLQGYMPVIVDSTGTTYYLPAYS